MPRSRFASPFLLAGLVASLAGCGPSGPVTPGPQGLFEYHCARCHAQAGEPGGQDIGGSRGPSLKKIGSATGMTADWLTEYIRDPRSKRPDAKLMPAFGGKMSDDEIRSLAEWLATKK